MARGKQQTIGDDGRSNIRRETIGDLLMSWESEFLKMCVCAEPNETIVVFDPDIVKLAEQLASSLGRSDLKFVYKEQVQ